MPSANDSPKRNGRQVQQRRLCRAGHAAPHAPGNLRAFVQATLRKPGKTGKSSNVRFASTRVDRCRFEEHQARGLQLQGPSLASIFMDPETVRDDYAQRRIHR